MLVLASQMVGSNFLQAAQPQVPLAILNIAIESESCAGGDGSIVVTARNPNDDTFQYTLIQGLAPNGPRVDNDTGVFPNLTSDAYQLNVRNPRTQQSRTAIVFLQGLIPLLVRQINVRNVTVTGGNDGVIEILVRGGLGAITATRDPETLVAAKSLALEQNEQIITFTGVPAGIYTITLQSEDTCAPTQFTVEVVEP